MSHRNARLTPHGRLLLCERVEIEGWKVREAAAAAGVSRQTAGKWLARWRAEGASGLMDRTSRPLRIARRVVGELWRRVVLLRLTRRRGPAWIAWHTELAPATVYRALRRHGLHRLRDPRAARAGGALLLAARRRPRPPRHQAPRPHRRRRRPASRRLQGADHAPRHRLGLRPRGRRRRHPARLRRGAHRRARRDGGRLPGARPGLLRGSWHRGPAPAHRQRQLLPLAPLRGGGRASMA